MNTDDIFSQLQQDLNNSLNQLNQSLQGYYNTPADFPAFNGENRFCPECGTRLPAGSKFCPECGTRADNNIGGACADRRAETTRGRRTSGASCRGILFTDTKALADKYVAERREVIEMFNKIRQRLQNYSMAWDLLDAAEYRQQLGKDPFWLDYNQLISDFMEDNGYKYGMKTPVFIIGGDDVIPIPKVEDTFGTSDDGQMPCDMCYCFSGHFFSDLWDGDHTIGEQDVRNVVSRLPLEDGEMESDMESDILCYFERCEEYYDDGIPVDHVMMTANASWLPASKTMSEHLPLIEHADDDEMVESGMYVSPPVCPDNEEAEKPLELSLKDAGMLLFNLHGSGDEGMSSFYHDRGVAFNMGMLEKTEARVFNTVACYGARYHGYERGDSMLLTSIHNNGFLLYAGSLIPVPMTDLYVPEGVEVHEGSGSEHLMPIYCMEQYAGLPAGEAMMKAKLEYFNTFRHMEEDDFSLATVMMFSLYGNPMLRIQRNDEVLRRAEEMHVLPKLPQTKLLAPVCVKRIHRIHTQDNSSASLLADIRGAVDNNLSALHAAIAKDLYSHFGFEPRKLDHIDAYTIPKADGSLEKGYMYAYVDRERAFANKTWVEVRENGMCKRIIKTK